ncbi:hypothetical protein Fcan01_25827 [Folsomia candida]|uniref:Uncharacterized protein n=1 Tax=Folsomia candida TaxID=158441 RepID=A0A226D429_FOLCA|nr:hypothetical protein Fcan01_25827 [Folsomia candida]
MATLGMWKLVQLFGRLYGDKLYLLPYKTSISNRQMLLIRNISRKRRYFKIFCTLCAFGHTLFCFASLCKPFFTRKGQTDPFLPGMSEAVRVVRVYVQILAALLPSTFLPMSYVIAFRPVVAEVILCKIIQFQKETQELTGIKTTHKHLVVELGMNVILWISFTMLLPVVVTGLYLQIDPLHVVVVRTAEENNTILPLLTRSMITLLVAYDIATAGNAFFIVGLMVVCSTNDMIQDLRCKPSFRHDLITRFKEITLYRKLFLWNKYTNQNFCSFSVPPLIFFGISVVVLTYFGTIRMWGKVGFFLYLAVPALSVFATCFIVIMIPYAARVLEFSENLILIRLGETSVSKFERKTWKSMRPLGIQKLECGSFSVCGLCKTPCYAGLDKAN